MFTNLRICVARLLYTGLPACELRDTVIALAYMVHVWTRRTDHYLDNLDPIAAPMRYCAKYLDLIDHTRETCVEDPDIIDPTRTNMC